MMDLKIISKSGSHMALNEPLKRFKDKASQSKNHCFTFQLSKLLFQLSE